MSDFKHSTAGNVRLYLVLSIAAAALFWIGGEKFYMAVTNLHPKELTYAEYVKQKPQDKWLVIKDCYLSLLDASFKRYKDSNTVTEAYVPVRGTEEDKDAKFNILVATKDPQTLDLLATMRRADTDEAARKFVLDNLVKLFPHRDVRGLVRVGIDLKEEDRKKLAALDNNLAPDFIILDEGAAPGFLWPSLMLVGGVGILGFMAWRFTRWLNKGTGVRQEPVILPPSAL